MEEKRVPFVVHEATMTRMERVQRRIWIMALVLIGLLVGSNTAWIIHFFG